MKASEIISVSCCGQGLPIECTKTRLALLVKRLEDKNQELHEDLSISNEFFGSQLRDLNGRNHKLKKKCDYMLGLLVAFALVVIFL